ncbi:RagB/SusD family nutrient uptake outer membrane protein [Pedobacter sp. N23S346]|uniref:RagB/SusD family nutrient uptake outer membrane protein n=1 Tax=Pedobacter sp. N23S346 TaxID=3402750 RepID=UPI003AC3F347
MKNISIKARLLFLLSFLIVSCKKELDLKSESAISNEVVFNSTDPGLMRAYVNNIYQAFPDASDFGSRLASISDEAHNNAGSWAGMSALMRSEISPSAVQSFSSGNFTGRYNWASLYSRIRQTNLFLSEVNQSPISSTDKNLLKGEVYFQRGYLYHTLVNMYGGVPLISKPYVSTDNFSVARNTFAESVQFVVDQCDSAAKYLPVVQSEQGRATKGAALTLKSRALLFAASDLYNTAATGYSNPELVRYTNISTSDRQTRWQKAKDAAKAVIDLGTYALYKPAPVSADDASKNYGDIFQNAGTSEDIFIKYFSVKMTHGDWFIYMVGQAQNPCGYHGWGNEAPLQQFVDDYEMSNGTAFSWNNPVAAAAPYQNRDPRFYATVLYDGAKWRTRPSDVSGDPEGKIQTGFFYNTSGVKKDGLDANGSGAVDSWNAGVTGYYLRKGIDPAINVTATQQIVPWRYMRYTEVLLNYAEAAIALGQESEGRSYINMIRARAFMPAIATTGDALVASLRHERRIELAFEELRYFDVRRWMIAPSTFQPAKAINIVYGSPTSGYASYIAAAASGTAKYTVTTAENRAWNPKFYFLPIEIGEMNKNPKLIQNPLY